MTARPGPLLESQGEMAARLIAEILADNEELNAASLMLELWRMRNSWRHEGPPSEQNQPEDDDQGQPDE